MENKAHKVYPSKVGWGLLAFVFSGFGVGMYHAIVQDDWTNLGIQTTILLLLVLLFNSISYEVCEKTLVVKTFFWFKREIPIESITNISETYNPISSPAASLDRLEIGYGQYNNVIISPKNKMDFIAHLTSISPKIVVKMRKRKKRNS